MRIEMSTCTRLLIAIVPYELASVVQPIGSHRQSPFPTLPASLAAGSTREDHGYRIRPLKES